MNGGGLSMPVLPLEPFVFPPDLLTQPLATENPYWRWWVLHTRPRAEKTLARNLLKHQIAFFLPLYQRERRFRSRVVTAHLPLFPGYVFLLGDNHTRVHALTTNTVAKTLQVADCEELHTDLSRVYHLMTSGAPLSPEERLQPGTPVEITAGPLAGLEGRVIRKGKRLKFFIEVHFLQRGASVEIDSWMIERRDP
jgi:transcription antitermination factor NusG